MKRVYIIIVLAILSASCFAQQPTTFILVRHAEKADDGTQDPDLAEVGKKRVQALLNILAETPITAVYSTPYKRTKNTVAPVAEAKGISLQQYQPFKVEQVDALIKQHAGGIVLIGGHSNDLPWIANLVTGTEKYKTWDDKDYDNILIVTVFERGKTATVTWLSYGDSMK